MAAEAQTAGSVAPRPRGASGTEGLSQREMDFPTVEDLRLRTRRRIPKFAFDFVAGGCGENLTVARNRAAFDAIEIVPRYGKGSLAVSTKVELFGQSYAAPLGMSPIGLGGIVWPRMEQHLARAAQAANVPYTLSTPASTAIETIGALAPDVFWFQLYAAPGDDFRISRDMMRRAERCGAKVLLVTIDTPVRAKRPQDMRNRLAVPFRPNLRTIFDIACHPAWLLEVARHGAPKCENFAAYAEAGASPDALAGLVQRELRGGFTWDAIRRLRDAWPRAMVVKGILDPRDAELALAAGADGIVVSNHGGRTFDGAPAAIDMLPAIKAVAGDATVLLDSGIRSGLDIVRTLALGAKAVMTGRPFLFGVGALGAPGGSHVLDILIEETRMAMGQIGASDLAEVAQAAVRHNNK
ncbi:MAG: alpha-hydroxy-acid oxidizing enzyme [Rhodospirillales bacterium]|nr:alpha-hydroxy-acid oxidizing enzyme [Rhodospirillales bacterium]